MVYWSDKISLLVHKDGSFDSAKKLSTGEVQEKYKTLKERDVNPDDDWCLDFLNTIFVQSHIQLSHNQVLI